MMKILLNHTKTISINNSDDHRLSFMASWIVVCFFLVTTALMLENITSVPTKTVSLFCWLTMALLFFYNALLVIKKTSPGLILVFFLIGLFFIINYLMFGYSDGFKYSVERFMFYVLPGCLFFCSIKRFDILFNDLYFFSKLIVPLSLLVTIMNRNNMSLRVYSMAFAYSLLFPIIILIYEYYINKKCSSLAFVLMGILSILLAGSRGPLLGIAFFCMSILVKRFLVEKNVLKALLLFLVSLVLLIAHEFILNILLELVGYFGWYSRTLSLFTNDFYHDSGRLGMYKIILDEIESNPFILHGIAGEYKLIGVYVHNIFLELLYTFGVLFGGIIILYITYRTVTTFWRFFTCNSLHSVLSFIMFCASLPGLLVSGTFWGSIYFWVWLFLDEGNNNYVNRGGL